jgi:hypothetical protein
MSEQTRTAARPSRILTAFPFDYPKAKKMPQDLRPDYYIFQRALLDNFLSDRTAVSKPKNKNF